MVFFSLLPYTTIFDAIRTLTEKRILGRGPSRKGALCATARMQNAPFGEAHTQSALFREGDTPRVRLSVSRRLRSGALVHAVATRFAEASTHTNPRRAIKILSVRDFFLGSLL